MNDGGSAFPIRGPATDEDLDRRFYGMTLRDYFAAKVMQAWLSDPELTWGSELPSLCAADSYRVADAMLKARK